MKVTVTIIAAVIFSCLGTPLSANAVSWSPLQEEHEEKAAKGIKVVGDKVCLFQSGTPDIKKAISTGDILVVYREGKSHELKDVGRIKAVSYVGDDYLIGEVIEGEITTGDIARKGDAASLVLSSDSKCK